MSGSQKSPNKKGPLTRGRYHKILSKSKGKQSPGKGRPSPTLVKCRTNFKPPKEIDISQLSEEEQLQKVLEVSKIESMTPDEQLRLAIAESIKNCCSTCLASTFKKNKNLNVASPTPPSDAVADPARLMPVPSIIQSMDEWTNKRMELYHKRKFIDNVRNETNMGALTKQAAANNIDEKAPEKEIPNVNRNPDYSGK